MMNIEVNQKVAANLGLEPQEYKEIQQILGRKPNFTELSIYSVMWSEHASYKNSIKWLKTLPRKGKHLLAEAGKENAGLVDEWGHMRLREKKYTPGEVDGKWTEEMKKDFEEWKKKRLKK